MSDSDKTDPKENVGYGKPPKEHRFKPGQSGNPAGRPKGSKNKPTQGHAGQLAKLILSEAEREIGVKENGEAVRMPVAKAVMRALAANAVKGVARSQQTFFEVTRQAAEHTDAAHYRLLETVINYKEGWEKEFEACDEAGKPRPDPVPHPDHLIIDYETEEVFLIGPLTRQERRQLRERQEWVNAVRENLFKVRGKFTAPTDPEQRARWISDRLAGLRRDIKMFEAELAREDIDPESRAFIEEDLRNANESVKHLCNMRRRLKREQKKASTSATG